MMNAETTLVPTSGPATPSPSSTIVPEISWPSTAGVGKATSALRTCRSVWHTPHACTRTRTSPASGAGTGISSIRIRPGAVSNTAAFMKSIEGSAAGAMVAPFALVVWSSDARRRRASPPLPSAPRERLLRDSEPLGRGQRPRAGGPRLSGPRHDQLRLRVVPGPSRRELVAQRHARAFPHARRKCTDSDQRRLPRRLFRRAGGGRRERRPGGQDGTGRDLDRGLHG